MQAEASGVGGCGRVSKRGERKPRPKETFSRMLRGKLWNFVLIISELLWYVGGRLLLLASADRLLSQPQL